ncbi:MAG: tRNA pseudouridine(38-40) synthase TruA [Hydrotalea sp.]|nr:tRNA pseudouridine(38-40) synthase TruA [Hydrotalea sp.]
MTRFKMTVSYHGGKYIGWQRQLNGASVQAVIEEALAKIEGAPVVIHAAGRTDSGVHATGQVISFDMARVISPEKLLLAVNYHLKPNLIGAIDCAVMPPDFHARFSATRRDYAYRLFNRSAPPVLERGLVWHVPRPTPLDIPAMTAAAQWLRGTHDFTSFRATECQAKSPIRSLDVVELTTTGDEIKFFFSARSFLHHQVRNMVGTLVEVGKGKRHPDDIKKILAAKNRADAGVTAPAHGLCLLKVYYDK